jgi:hypothetical protein
MATIQLTGVLESGGNRGTKVPGNPRRTILITQTESLTVRLTVLDALGTRVDLNNGQLLALTVRKGSTPFGAPVFPSRLGIPQPELGIAIFELVPSDTDPNIVLPGQYTYDIWMTQADGTRDPLVPISPFVIEPTVNQPTDTPTVAPPVPVPFLSAIAHEKLRQLIHFIPDGPANGFASGAFKESLPSGSPFPASVTWYVAADKAQKIVEKLITRNPNKTPSSIVWNMYGEDGVTIVGTVIDTIAYSGVIETSRLRAITP